MPGGLSHDSHLLLSGGRVWRVGRLFERALTSGRVDYEVPSSDGEGVFMSKVVAIESRKVRRIFRVTTSSGRSVAVHGGRFIEVLGSRLRLAEAAELRRGSRILVVSKIDFPVGEPSIVSGLPPETILTGGPLLREFRRRMKELREKRGLRPLAEELGLSLSALYNYLSGRRKPPLRVVRMVLDREQVEGSPWVAVKVNPREKPVKLPNRITPMLAELLGSLSIIGTITDWGLIISPPTTRLERRLRLLIMGVFGPELEIVKDVGSGSLLIRSRALSAYLRAVFQDQRVPPSIFLSDQDAVEHFMKGFFVTLSEGGMLAERWIPVNDPELLAQLTYLILVLGANVRIRREDWGFMIKYSRSGEKRVVEDTVQKVEEVRGPFMVHRPVLVDPDLAVVAGLGGVIVFL